MTVSEALQTRRAFRSFLPNSPVALDELKAIITTANLSPSSMNLQPWELLVVMSEEDKERLKKVSYNQAKIAEASAVLVVLGNLHHHEHAKAVAEKNVELGYFGPEGIEKFVTAATNAYADKAAMARDESFRSCSLWSMAFMLAAQEAGWSTAPMGGFVPEDVVREFGIPEHFIPTLIICVGKPNPDVPMAPRSLRFSADDRVHVGNW